MKEISLVSLRELSESISRYPFNESAHHCFLILAHSDAIHFSSLLKALHHENACVIVHLDRKCSINSFVKQLSNETNAAIILDRHSISWGGFSMIEAMLDLLVAGIESTQAMRFTFLSGADFPIRKIEDFIRSFSNSDKEFIPSIKIEEDSPVMRRFNRPHLQGYIPFLNNRHDNSDIDKDLATRIKSELEALLEKNGRHQMSRFRPFSEFYKGSQWMSITRDCAEELLEMRASKPLIESFFRYTSIPDESMLQTMIMHSSRRDKVRNESLHYIAWKSNAKGDGSDVVNLGLKDFDAIMRSNKWFARKFTTAHSNDLLQKIEENQRTST